MLVLQTSQSQLSSVLSNLSSEPFMNVELVLRLFYMLGEVITDKVRCIHDILYFDPVLLLGLLSICSNLEQLTFPILSGIK